MSLVFSTLIAWSLFILQSTPLSAEENFLLLNGLTSEVVLEFGPHIDKRISPCSTFKMTLSLMGYDAGILLNENTPILNYKEGYDDFIESWKSPQTPLSWMKYSCVWYAKLLALQLGSEKIQNYLALFNYGNQDISGGLPNPGPINPAWINSSLTISPREQVRFIQSVILNKLPISSHATQMTRALLFKEESLDGWKLFGKTGWSGSDLSKDGKTLEHGGFIGWIEKDDNFFPFAYLIREQKIDLDQRIPRVKQLLTESNVMTYGEGHATNHH
ncbi:MAG: penicillin-binding transpeptidase domain-containing protein [Chlamydiota bacterium]